MLFCFLNHIQIFFNLWFQNKHKLRLPNYYSKPIKKLIVKSPFSIKGRKIRQKATCLVSELNCQKKETGILAIYILNSNCILAHTHRIGENNHSISAGRHTRLVELLESELGWTLVYERRGKTLELLETGFPLALYLRYLHLCSAEGRL